ncbi:Prefoldin, partial [Gaertneriomyces semiglobifer]
IEIQNTIQEKSRQLTRLRTELQALDRQKRVSDLTAKELAPLGADVGAYRSVGKMFIRQPLPEITKELLQRKEDSDKQVTNLTRAAQKVEKELINAQTAWKEIMHRNKSDE